MPVKVLRFSMQRQVQTNWCWAANAASISLFYSAGSTWTQCKVACSALGRTDCCNSPVSRFCNVAWYLERALSVTSNFRSMLGSSTGMNDITKEIGSGLVIGVRIGWNGGGGHFISIYGYDDTTANNPYIYVDDPITGPSLIKLGELISNYQQAGTWTHTYYTTSAGAPMLKFMHLNTDLLTKARTISPVEIIRVNGLEKFGKSRDQKKTTAYPHGIFIIDFTSLKGAGDPVIKEEGVRLVDKAENGNDILYDFSDAGPSADLRQIYHGDTFTSAYRTVLDRLDERNQIIPEVFELRVVRQPQLKVEAFWLHRNGDSSDRFIPIIDNSFLVAGEQYTYPAFIDLLRKEARNYLTDRDDTLGG